MMRSQKHHSRAVLNHSIFIYLFVVPTVFVTTLIKAGIIDAVDTEATLSDKGT